MWGRGQVRGRGFGMGWFRSRSTDGGDDTSFEDRLVGIGPGVPGRCPACDGLGYIDSIDIGHRYQIQHCKECLHRWEYLFDADGVVVGLTELDSAGQPVARARVRPLRATAAAAPAVPPVDPAPPVAVEAGAEAEAEAEADEDLIVDLRDPEVRDTPVVDVPPPEQLSPAEWLRQAARH